MDIISYSKAKKAGKAVGIANKRIGHTDKFKHGDEDVKDIYVNTDERIQQMELKLAPAKLNTLLSEESTRTMINLNRHWIKVLSIQKAKTYSMNNLVYESFTNGSQSIINIKSSVSYDTSKFGYTSYYSTSNGYIETITLDKKDINKVIVSIAYIPKYDSNKKINLSGISKNLIISNNKISLAKKENYYETYGYFISDVIDIKGTSVLKNISSSVSNYYSGEAIFSISLSKDGISFSEYTEFLDDTDVINSDYMKIKIELKPKIESKLLHLLNFDSNSEKDFDILKGECVFNGRLLLKNPEYGKEAIVVTKNDYEIDIENIKNFELYDYEPYLENTSYTRTLSWTSDSSSVYNNQYTLYGSKNAFDGSEVQKSGWASRIKLDTSPWLSITFYSAFVLKKIKIAFNTTNTSKNPPNYVRALGSSDGTNWKELGYSYLSIPDGGSQNVYLNNNEPYRYYKFEFGIQNRYVRISELYMYGEEPERGINKLLISGDSGETWYGKGIKKVNNIFNTEDIIEKGFSVGDINKMSVEEMKIFLPKGKIKFLFYIKEAQEYKTTGFAQFFMNANVGYGDIGVSNVSINTLEKEAISIPKIYITKDNGKKYHELENNSLKDVSNIKNEDGFKIKIEISPNDIINAMACSWI